ncbi:MULTISPECIES: preprotein translocase subunit YajC [Halomonas]|uniref:Preprotein translocase subunit YajC n=1 Tax=Halomonas ventosae TaxID=229007 RepID=A0A4R6GUR4_9GAMM|nr:preprotein translocase subunit YajC [Halomonas ventosae]TDN99201.1 hypothetical protein DFO68_12528 [Halomonas ventosae]
MVWLLIIVIVGLVFAPALWLRPSRGQQRISRLRAAAREAGVTVRLETPPLHEADGSMAAYRWAFPQQQPGPDFVLVRDVVGSALLKPFRRGWRWRIEPLRALPASVVECLEAALAELPEDALVLESSAAALTLWWEESLEVGALAPLLQRLRALRDALSGRPDRPHRRASTPALPR